MKIRTAPAAVLAAMLAAAPFASAAENANSLEGFEEIRVAPGVSTSSNFIDVLLPYFIGFPEGMEGRQSLEMKIRKGDGAYVVDIVKSGYLDDSVKGEHYRGFVIPTTEGWELLDLGVKTMCYRGMTDGRCN
jgi:hypothetical protein